MDDEGLVPGGENGPATGEIFSGSVAAPGDITYVAVVLEAGIRYQIDLEGRATGVGTLVDPLLVGIFTSTNIRLVGSDDNSGVDENSRLIFTPATSGTYLIAVSNAPGSAAGSYTLFVDAEETSSRPDSNFVAVEDSGDPFIESRFT
ncbi:MAG: hypothetical protein JKY60_09675 [Kordiimonadaceae bacterium]|nr:hypothetical protein [Kordiimonadaceae bacterium]